MFLTDDDAAKFRSRVIARSTDECWSWTGSSHGDGYGKMWVPSLKRTILAHRLAYAISCGRVPTSTECVCHRCDNPGCVNPQHLFLGTQQDNIADMIAKGRNYVAPKKPRPPKAIRNGDKTRCPAGHTYDATRTKAAHGVVRASRACRRCDAERARARRSEARLARGDMPLDALRFFCRKGHRLDEANIYVSPSRGRRCRECLRTKNREWMRAQRAKAA